MDENPINESPKISPEMLQKTVSLWQAAKGGHCVPVTGSSMFPLLQARDQVLVQHHPHFQRGDVIVFYYDGRLTIHRIIFIDKQIQNSETSTLRITTKGDNAPRFDTPLQPEQILGRVVLVKRGERSLRIDTPLWRAVGWFIAINTIIASTLYRWGRFVRQKLLRQQTHSIINYFNRIILYLFKLWRQAIQVTLARWKR